ncbi:hypothetical protein ACFYXQ_03650 [Nocardia jiangxiensis]|uniref:Uncharacterized protein n=1 Tax=Nocardia jiangxiensis TaxID=282685 RepID=A0ABW6RS68_9NOCA
MTVSELRPGEIFVGLLTDWPAAGERGVLETDEFTDFDAVREWAAERVGECVADSGDGWDFRVDVARVDPHAFDLGAREIIPRTIVARASWDKDSGAVIWQTVGPFTFDDYPVL